MLVPVYNREEYVDEAIRSVVAQDFADFELLLVDDGSTDRTPEILRAWAEKDSRVVVVTSPVNQGIPAALNLGLSHARGTYVARLDSDDLMMPRRLRAQAAVLDSRQDIVLVSCAYELMDAKGNPLEVWPGDEPHEAVVFLLNFYNIVGGGGQVMFRRDQVLAEGGYACEVPSSEDYDLWVRLLRRGHIVSLPFVGMRKRVHATDSLKRYANVKRANWLRIMRGSLERYLERDVRDDEIDALITVWRHDGKPGMARTADRVMREAFVRFRRENPDSALRRRVRERIARQWRDGANAFTRAGQRGEAWKYRLRALRWRLIRR